MTKAADADKPSKSVMMRGLGYWLVLVLLAFIVGYMIPIRDTFALRDQLAQENDTSEALLLQSRRAAVSEEASTAALYVAIEDYDNAGRHVAAFFAGLPALRGELSAEQSVVLDSLTLRRDDIVQLLRAKDGLALYQLLDVTSRFDAAVRGRDRSFTDPRLR